MCCFDLIPNTVLAAVVVALTMLCTVQFSGLPSPRATPGLSLKSVSRPSGLPSNLARPRDFTSESRPTSGLFTLLKKLIPELVAKIEKQR